MYTMRRITKTLNQKWVTSKAVIILKDDINIGAKELQKKLQTDHKCIITYDMIWRGKRKSSFQGLWQMGREF